MLTEVNERRAKRSYDVSRKLNEANLHEKQHKQSLEQQLKIQEKLADRRVVQYMEKVAKAHKEAEQWEQENKKVIMRHNLQESMQAKEHSQLDSIERVLRKEMELNMNALQRGEEGVLQADQIRAMAPLSKQSASTKNL